VSNNDSIPSQAKQNKKAVTVQKAMREEAHLETMQPWCRFVVLRQTIPDASCGDQKSSVADG